MKRWNLFLILLCCSTYAYSENVYGEVSSEEFLFSSNSRKLPVKLGVEWLYWKVEQTNMSIGAFIHEIRNSDDPHVSWDPALTAKPLNLDFQWSNGFKIYAERDFCCCEWTITTSYYHIHTSAHLAHHQAPNINSSLNFQGVALATNVFTFLSALRSAVAENISVDWTRKIHYFDYDIARNLSYCSFLLRPYLGFRILWTDQDYNFEGNTFDPEDFEGYLSEKFVGYGLQGGLRGDYSLPYGFSIHGYAGGALLYSKFNTNINFFAVASLLDDALEHGSVRSAYKLWQSIYGVDFGLAIEYAFSISCIEAILKLGWEQHMLFDMNRLSFPGSNLYMQGLTLGGAVAF